MRFWRLPFWILIPGNVEPILTIFPPSTATVSFGIWISSTAHASRSEHDDRRQGTQAETPQKPEAIPLDNENLTSQTPQEPDEDLSSTPKTLRPADSMRYDYNDTSLSLLAGFDTDAFNRWEVLPAGAQGSGLRSTARGLSDAPSLFRAFWFCVLEEARRFQDPSHHPRPDPPQNPTTLKPQDCDPKPQDQNPRP